MNAFDRIVDALHDHGWPAMTEQQAFEVLASQRVPLSSLIQPIGRYLDIAKAEWKEPHRRQDRTATVLAFPARQPVFPLPLAA